MNKTQEALKLAMEALKQIDEAMPFPVAKLAQKVIREALAEQPASKPLTDEEIQTIAFEAVKENWDWLRFARAIEAAYGIKENT